MCTKTNEMAREEKEEKKGKLPFVHIASSTLPNPLHRHHHLTGVPPPY